MGNLIYANPNQLRIKFELKIAMHNEKQQRSSYFLDQPCAFAAKIWI